MTPLQQGPIWLRDPQATGSAIRQARRKLRMSQAALGTHVGRTQAAISQIETGRRKELPRDVLTTMAQVLHAPGLMVIATQSGNQPFGQIADSLLDALAVAARLPVDQQEQLGEIMHRLVAWGAVPDGVPTAVQLTTDMSPPQGVG